MIHVPLEVVGVGKLNVEDQVEVLAGQNLPILGWRIRARPVPRQKPMERQLLSRVVLDVDPWLSDLQRVAAVVTRDEFDSDCPSHQERTIRYANAESGPATGGGRDDTHWSSRRRYDHSLPGRTAAVGRRHSW